MDYVYFLLMGAAAIVAAVVATVLLHELGHAVPMLLLSKQPVSLYIGSLGEAEHNMRFKLGRLSFHFHYNPLRWYYGCCVPPEDISVGGRLLYIATGPLATAGGCIFCWHWLRTEEPEGYLQFFVTCAMLYSIYTLLNTVIPRSLVGYNTNGQSYGNDGHSFLALSRYVLFDGPYREMDAAINNKDYSLAAEIFERHLKAGAQRRIGYQRGAYVYFYLKQYDLALELMEAIRSKYPYKVDDHIMVASIYLAQLRPVEALAILEPILEGNPNHTLALNAKGYALGILDRHQEAIDCLNRAITLAPAFAYALDNRGFSKLQSGQLEEGLADLQKSLELDEENAFVFRNLGLYHLKKRPPEQALHYLEKASAMEADMPLLPDFIQEAQSMAASIVVSAAS